MKEHKGITHTQKEKKKKKKRYTYYAHKKGILTKGRESNRAK